MQKDLIFFTQIETFKGLKEKLKTGGRSSLFLSFCLLKFQGPSPIYSTPEKKGYW